MGTDLRFIPTCYLCRIQSMYADRVQFIEVDSHEIQTKLVVGGGSDEREDYLLDWTHWFNGVIWIGMRWAYSTLSVTHSYSD